MGEPGDLRDGVFVVIAEIDAILLVRHNYGEGLWSLPGGGIKYGEIVTEAVRREAKEETAITDIPGLRQIGLFTMVKRYGLVILFEALGWFGTPQPDGQEIAECKFFTPEDLEINKSQIYPAQFKLIQVFLEFKNHQFPLYGKLTDPPTIGMG